MLHVSIWSERVDRDLTFIIYSCDLFVARPFGYFSGNETNVLSAFNC